MPATRPRLYIVTSGEQSCAASPTSASVRPRCQPICPARCAASLQKQPLGANRSPKAPDTLEVLDKSRSTSRSGKSGRREQAVVPPPTQRADENPCRRLLAKERRALAV